MDDYLGQFNFINLWIVIYVISIYGYSCVLVYTVFELEFSSTLYYSSDYHLHYLFRNDRLTDIQGPRWSFSWKDKSEEKSNARNI